jgi:hypothetical protein
MSLKIRKTRNKNEWTVRLYNHNTKKYIIVKKYNTKDDAQKHIDDINNVEDTVIDVGNDKKSID